MKKKQYKKIGEGSFSKVYKHVDKNRVLIYSVDRAKFYLAENPIKCKNFPILKKIGKCDKTGYHIYESEFYPRADLKSSLRADQYQLYLELRRIYGISRDFLWKGFSERDVNIILRDIFKINLIKFKSVRRAILDYMDILDRYNEAPVFEISPRNVAVKNGTLILLDCFYFYNKMELK